MSKLREEIMQFLKDEQIVFGEHASVSTNKQGKLGGEYYLVDLISKFTQSKLTKKDDRIDTLINNNISLNSRIRQLESKLRDKDKIIDDLMINNTQAYHDKINKEEEKNCDNCGWLADDLICENANPCLNYNQHKPKQ